MGAFWALRPLLLGPRVARVATADLAHVGHGYSTPEEIESLPRGKAALAARLEEEIGAMLSCFAREDFRATENRARALRSDHANMVPLLAAIGGPRGQDVHLLSFRLSDYGPILGRPAPCVVATALVAYVPRPSPTA